MSRPASTVAAPRRARLAAGRVRRLRRTALLAAAAAVALTPLPGWGSPPLWALPLLTAAVALAERCVVRLPYGQRHWTLALTAPAVGVALLLAPGGWTVPAVAVGLAVAKGRQVQARRRLQYDVARGALATSVAAVLAWSVGGGGVAAACGLLGWWLVDEVLVAVAVAATSTRPVRSLLASNAPLSLQCAVGNGAIGLLAAHLLVTAPVGIVGLAVPVALLWASHDLQTRRSAEVRLLSELAHGQERAASRSADVSAQVVLTAAARLFGGADVEMVLLATDGPVRFVGDENGVPSRVRVDPDAFDEPWVVRALSGSGVVSGVADGSPWCTVVLGPVTAPRAVLCARRTRGAAAFGRRELRLAAVLAGEAQTWLATPLLAGRIPGQRSGEPVLGQLRDGADRLARLAEGDGGVDAIVAELHLVERAVASLLGAVALAEPGLPAVPQQRSGSPAAGATEWTTTGVLR